MVHWIPLVNLQLGVSSDCWNMSCIHQAENWPAFLLKSRIMTSVICRKFWKIFMMYMMNILSKLSNQIVWKLIYWIYWQVEVDCKVGLNYSNWRQNGNWWHGFISEPKIMKIFEDVADIYLLRHKYRVLHNFVDFGWASLMNIC